MSVLPDTPEGQLSQLLGCTIAQLTSAPRTSRRLSCATPDVGERLKDERRAHLRSGSIL